MAREHCHITHIFETHRNEDLVCGAAALISPEQLAALDEALVVDVRSPESFCGAHIPGAHALPLALLGQLPRAPAGTKGNKLLRSSSLKRN